MRESIIQGVYTDELCSIPRVIVDKGYCDFVLLVGLLCRINTQHRFPNDESWAIWLGLTAQVHLERSIDWGAPRELSMFGGDIFLSAAEQRLGAFAANIVMAGPQTPACGM
jgi:hypothetical protein